EDGGSSWEYIWTLPSG
nr:Chain C, C3S1 [synthetic construct]